MKTLGESAEAFLYESANIFENALLIFASCSCNTPDDLVMTSVKL